VEGINKQQKGEFEMKKLFEILSKLDQNGKAGLLWVIAQLGDAKSIPDNMIDELVKGGFIINAAWIAHMKGDFQKAFQLYKAANMEKEAAICAANMEQWSLASKMFERAGDYRHAAHYAEQDNNFKRAMRLHAREGDYMGALDCARHLDSKEDIALYEELLKAALTAQEAKVQEKMAEMKAMVEAKGGTIQQQGNGLIVSFDQKLPKDPSGEPDPGKMLN
jgi:tetratricopeptide (TPR) repeat protein